MLNMSDLVAFSGVDEDVIRAIAEHEHIPAAAACSLANCLSQDIVGEQAIRNMIIDDIRGAQARGHRERVQDLLHVLHHYLRSHPDALPESHPWSAQF